jgi:hypothetical protein
MSATFADSVKRAQRSIDSARALFREGLVPECHDYMASALRVLLEAWGGLAPAVEHASFEPARAQEQALAELERAGYRHTDRLRAAVATTAEPSSSAALLPPNVDWIWAEVERLARFSTRRAMMPRARKLARWRRGVVSALVLAFALLLAIRLWGRPHARASGVFSEVHPAAKAIDGLEATEWLLPDATAGWLDVLFPSARSVHSVRLLNAHNVFYVDRGAKAVRVTAFTAQGKAVSVEGSFARLTEERSVLDLPLEAKGVTRVRVEILTYFRVGGGLAEIEVH